ncbi:MAG: hypothetical protein KIT73_18450, partial [Burkholderiales bacterium]|nr:hypothetical protein [Burkholderiales bacterium]
SVVSVAGAAAGAGTAAVGVGANVSVLNKRSDAFIGSGVTAFTDGDIVVSADSTEDFSTFAVAGGGSGTVSVMGAAGVPVFDIVTRAFVGDDPSDTAASRGAGNVHARGSIEIAADDRNEIDLVSGSATGSGSVAVGASGGVAVIRKTTEAFVGIGARVRADGFTARDVASGSFSVAYEPTNTGVGGAPTNGAASSHDDLEVGLPVIEALDARGDGSDDRTDASFGGQRTLDMQRALDFRGLAITATNRDDLETYSLSAAGSYVAVAVSAAVNVVETTTRAYVGDGAQVNVDATDSHGMQGVLVGAGNDFYHLSVAATGAGGFVGVAPGVGVSVIKGKTEAFIGAGAAVEANDDVTVKATATENLVVIGAGAAGGWVGAAGAVTAPVIDNDTGAWIGAGARVDAGGDVQVRAVDDTEAFVLTGAVAGGVVGVGASVGVVSVTKDTLAFVGAGAQVDAKGHGIGVADVIDGAVTESGFGTLIGHGLIVQAESSEALTQITVAGGAGLVGVAGAVGVTLVDSNTHAFIGVDARINQTADNAAASAAQSVFVGAANRLDGLVIGGGVGGGFVGVGGAVSVGSIRNDTSAVIESGAQVRARRDVEVNAVSAKDLEGYTVSAAGGFVGVQGSVSVWSVGAPIEKNVSNDRNQSRNALQGDNGRMADSQAGDTSARGTASVSGLLSSYDKGNTGDGRSSNAERLAAGMQSAANRINAAAPSQSSLTAAINSAAATRGTEAIIRAGAVITAGEDIEVQAMGREDVTVLVGGLAGGFVGVGVSVGVLTFGGNVAASAAGTLSAGGHLWVRANQDQDAIHTALASAGGAVGIGAAVTVLNDRSTRSAWLADGADVLNAGEVVIAAHGDQNLRGFTGQLTSGAAAVGA